jgi:carboxypeptidase D
MKEYLRSEPVKAAIHVNASVVWHDCSDAVYKNLNTSGVSSLSLLFKYVDRLRVLLYSGQFDLTCPHVGTENFLNNFNWSQRDSFIVCVSIFSFHLTFLTFSLIVSVS